MYKYAMGSLSYRYGISGSNTWNFRPALNFTKSTKFLYLFKHILILIAYTVAVAKLLYNLQSY